MQYQTLNYLFFTNIYYYYFNDLKFDELPTPYPAKSALVKGAFKAGGSVSTAI